LKIPVKLMEKSGNLRIHNPYKPWMIKKLNLSGFFFCNLKKIRYFGGPKHSSITALPVLDKKNSSTYSFNANLKFQPDNFINNEEMQLYFLQFWLLVVHFFQKYTIFSYCDIDDIVNTSIIHYFSVFWSVSDALLLFYVC
jgi:hypothetical protein